MGWNRCSQKTEYDIEWNNGKFEDEYLKKLERS